jgi:NUMOD4 motif/HNH endonuclease
MTRERWKQVVGWPDYEVSDLGRVRRLTTRGGRPLDVPRLKKLTPDKEGYLRVVLSNGKTRTCKVHRMVLGAFVGPCPPGQETRHKNGRQDDNCLTNLLWGTRREQFEDQVRVGSDTRGERNGAAKLTNAQALEIRRRLAAGERGINLAREFRVGQPTITRIKKGVRYATA